MLGAHLFYLNRYKDGVVRILSSLVMIGIYFWFKDFYQLYFKGGFTDGEGRILPSYKEWFASHPIKKQQTKLFNQSKEHFADAKDHFKEAGRHFAEAKNEFKSLRKSNSNKSR
jgi:hypothetical protein